MKNFYYEVSFNLAHPSVKELVKKSGVVFFSESITDIVIRSRSFISYAEVCNHLDLDFQKKMNVLYPGKTDEMRMGQISVVNPAFAVSPEMAKELYEKTGREDLWRDNSCSMIFYHDLEGDEDDETTDEGDIVLPDSWILKYEILYSDDEIDLTECGGLETVALTNLSSSLH